MNCPNCGAPMRLDEGADHGSCGFCLTISSPDPGQDGLCVLDSAMENCPLCQGELNHAVLAGVRLLSCPHCRGMLIPMEDFMTTAERLRATLPGSSVPLAWPPDAANFSQYRTVCIACGADPRSAVDAPVGSVGAPVGSADAPVGSRSLDNADFVGEKRDEGVPRGPGGPPHIDSCENRAVIWFDAGELRRISFAPDYQYRPSLES